MKKLQQPNRPSVEAHARMGKARLGLFVFIFLVVMMMGFQMQDVMHQLAQGKMPQAVTPVKAEEKMSAPPSEKKPDSSGPVGPMKPDTAPSPADASAPSVETPAIASPDNYSDAEVNILKRLSERRQELDRRARELDQREALVKLIEQRVDKKKLELKAIQDQVRQAIGEATAEQKAQADSLVKIYESMKPKEAARIFENLDIPSLLQVVVKMKESKVALILAAMDPAKAKEITSALMEKKPLPPSP